MLRYLASPYKKVRFSASRLAWRPISSAPLSSELLAEHTSDRDWRSAHWLREHEPPRLGVVERILRRAESCPAPSAPAPRSPRALVSGPAPRRRAPRCES